LELEDPELPDDEEPALASFDAVEESTEPV